VLLASDADALLETVRSRCRDVSFRTPSPSEVADALVRDGVDYDAAHHWSRVAGAHVRAAALASDSDARAQRAALVDRLLTPVGRDCAGAAERAGLVAGLPTPVRGPGDALELAEMIDARAKSVRDRVAEASREHDELFATWLRETKRAATDRLRREQRRAEQV